VEYRGHNTELPLTRLRRNGLAGPSALRSRFPRESFYCPACAKMLRTYSLTSLAWAGVSMR